MRFLSEYCGVLWDVWRVASSMLMLAVMCLAVVCLAMCGPFRPDPPPAPIPDRVQRAENERLRSENARLEGENLTLRVQLDVIRRGAVWLPPRPDPAGPALIPPQQLEVP